MLFIAQGAQPGAQCQRFRRIVGFNFALNPIRRLVSLTHVGIYLGVVGQVTGNDSVNIRQLQSGIAINDAFSRFALLESVDDQL